MDLGRQSLSRSVSGRSAPVAWTWPSKPFAFISGSANAIFAANAAAENAINSRRFMSRDLIFLAGYRKANILIRFLTNARDARATQRMTSYACNLRQPELSPSRSVPHPLLLTWGNCSDQASNGLAPGILPA